jgi:replication factor C subunit 2/4
VGNTEAVSRLKAIAQDGNMPNLLISGSPGIGKTTSVHCLARALLGTAYKDAVLELNASDDRTLDVVRNKIKTFAKQKVIFDPNAPGRQKVIILDEADSILPASQQALRRIMELYSSTTRFALACNDSSKIIEPIQSRCAIVRFQRLADTDLLQRLQYVIEQEKVTATNDGLEALLFTAEGDMRQALNNLQATWEGYGLVDANNVFKVADQPHPLILREVIKLCLGNKFMEAHKKLDELQSQGYSAQDIIITLGKVVRNTSKAENIMTEYIQLQYLKEIGTTHMRIVEGVESPLQLSGLVARLCKAVSASSST